MSIPEEIARVLLKNPYGNTDNFKTLYINTENYGTFRAEVTPWEVTVIGCDLYFMGLRVVVAKDPLNVWSLA